MTAIAAYDLHRMLKQVTPHTSNDDTLPAITAVHLEVRDGFLFAVTTDRFTMAIARQAVLNEGEWRAAVPGTHITSLMAWLKNEESTTLQLAIDGESLTLSGASNSLTLKALSSSHTIPDWRKLVRRYLEMEAVPVPLTGVTAKYLSRWKDAAQILHMWQSAPKAPLVFMDDAGEFIGMQMPILNEHTTRDELTSEWLKCLTRYAYVGGERYNLDAELLDADGDPWEYTGEERAGEPVVRLHGIEGDDYLLSLAVDTFGLRPNA